MQLPERWAVPVKVVDALMVLPRSGTRMPCGVLEAHMRESLRVWSSDVKCQKSGIFEALLDTAPVPSCAAKVLLVLMCWSNASD
jgi:hypothetical protein